MLVSAMLALALLVLKAPPVTVSISGAVAPVQSVAGPVSMPASGDGLTVIGNVDESAPQKLDML